MNLELIRSNLAACEEEAREGRKQNAIDAACQTARLLLIQAAAETEGSEPTEEELRRTCIALMGVAGGVQQQLNVLAPRLETANLVPKLKERTNAVRQKFANAEQQTQELTQANRELLDQEEALRKQKKELEDQLKKVEELKKLREQELGQLQEKLERQRMDLEDLEAQYGKCARIYDSVEAELQENGAIIHALPKSVGVESVDELMDHARQQQEALEQAGLVSGGWIRQVLEEIHRVQRIAAGEENP